MSDSASPSTKTASITNLIRRAVLTHAVTFGAKRLIVFLTPGYEWRHGGVMSIVTIYRESVALKHVHHARVALCTVPGEPIIFKYSWFKNRSHILDLESLLKRCKGLKHLMLHIPEYAVNQVSDWLATVSGILLQNVRDVQLNVLLQNIDVLQGQNVPALKRFGRVSCTTAHEAYTTTALRHALEVPIHRLGVCRGPEHYSRSSYYEKDPLLIVSHDKHPLKEQLLEQIAHRHPGLNIQVIENLSYEDYKKLAGRAKWSLTFGEGLDGYFAETIWSGGVGFAVFNDRFFTPAFAQLETVYPSWEDLMNRLPTDLQRLDEPVAYERCWRKAYDLLSDLYGVDRFRKNLRMFYRGQYTFP
jgi:hypothetical protein